MRYEFTNCMCIAELLLRKVVRTGGAISMSLAREWTGLQMRMVTGGKLARGTVFGNLRAEAGLEVDAMALGMLASAPAGCRRDSRRDAGATTSPALRNAAATGLLQYAVV